MLNEYDPLIPSTFDKKVYYDDSMPPIYDDYIDESGFGRVSTLGSSDPTILEDVESYCDEYGVDLEECQLYFVIPLSWERFQSIMMRTKLLLMMIFVMKLML